MYRVIHAAEGSRVASDDFDDLLSALFDALTRSLVMPVLVSIFDGDALVCVVVAGRFYAPGDDQAKLDVAAVVVRAAGIRRTACIEHR